MRATKGAKIKALLRQLLELKAEQAYIGGLIMDVLDEMPREDDCDALRALRQIYCTKKDIEAQIQEEGYRP